MQGQNTGKFEGSHLKFSIPSETNYEDDAMALLSKAAKSLKSQIKDFKEDLSMNELQKAKEETVISLLEKVQQTDDAEAILDLTRAIEVILEIKIPSSCCNNH
ncbi:hypothetical protein [Staphylococcus sp. IVB6214]|uniref:hypothetical protein n=1 Tax=Staphylococcus sp. IVB6214 TaxID=2989766 RepID=UPI0021CF6D41|nr:hypothetical protein [Staphylococcus sp. IVB6214]UXR83194.1 hypothetical protein MUA51_03835 [Staphylococcus sp. IVB6214]